MPRYSDENLPAPPPLPKTVQALVAQRKVARTRKLKDEVEDVFLKLWLEPDFERYIRPIWRKDAVEGSLIDDDVYAAQMIREYATGKGYPLAENATSADLRKALDAVKRLYHVSRNEQRRKAQGEFQDAAE